MKNFFISALLALFFATGYLTAEAIDNPTGVSFIYINGSNNLSYKNRAKFKIAFEENVKKLHPQIKKRFENDETINKLFLKNGEFYINPEPITFYWGNRSLKVVETLDKDLKSASKYSPKIAHQARSIFAHCLHDAVWVQKPQNMSSVLEELHSIVKSETDKGNRVVLLGYSAGSFVTYQYYMTKATTIIPSEITLGKYNSEIKNIIAQNPINPTCFDALIEANVLKLNTSTGKYSPNPNVDAFRKSYLELDEITPHACFSNGTVKGVVGFASPARLFYSDLLDSNSSINFISQLMSKNIVENNVFYLTVNYSNDPFGFSNAANFTYKSLTEFNTAPANDIINGNGFIYNKSNNYVPRTFVTAHLAYWDTPKRFSKAIVKTFNEGYRNFYNLNK